MKVYCRSLAHSFYVMSILNNYMNISYTVRLNLVCFFILVPTAPVDLYLSWLMWRHFSRLASLQFYPICFYFLFCLLLAINCLHGSAHWVSKKITRMIAQSIFFTLFLLTIMFRLMSLWEQYNSIWNICSHKPTPTVIR